MFLNSKYLLFFFTVLIVFPISSSSNPSSSFPCSSPHPNLFPLPDGTGQVSGISLFSSSLFSSVPFQCVDQWLAVPYALPPLNSLRFQPPQPLPLSSSRILNSDPNSFPSPCLQDSGGNED